MSNLLKQAVNTFRGGKESDGNEIKEARVRITQTLATLAIAEQLEIIAKHLEARNKIALKKSKRI